MTSRTCLSIILAAGEGTRMKSTTPKVLHKVAGLPMVAHVASAARQAGAGAIAMVVGHGAEAVRKAAGGFAPEAEIFEQTERLGTAHAVLAAREAIARGHDDILVMFGDTPLIEGEALSLARARLAAGVHVVVMGFRTDKPAGYGRLMPDPLAARAVGATDPAQAINLFGDGAVNAPALIESLRGSIAVRTRYKNWAAAVRADGPLFTLPAGEVKLAVGAEYRRDSLDYLQSFDLVTDGPLSFGIDGLPDKRIVKALYGELAIPLFDAGDNFPGSLNLSAAGRYEDYSDVGDTANPKFGARWEPLPGLALRASYGRSFRAPFFDELVGTANALYQTFRLNDPASPTGQTAVLLLLGYRPDLGPEKATSWTAGFDFEPRFLSGVKLSLTWFDIRYRDRIASANGFLQQFLARRDIYGGLIDDNPDPALVASYFGDPSFSNPIGIGQGEVMAIIDARTRNLSRSTVQGLDFDLAYTKPLGGGSINLSVGGTRLFTIDNRITDTAPRNNVVGTLGAPVKLRLRSRAGVILGAFDGGVALNHVASYRNLSVKPAERVKSWTTVDLQLGVRIGETGGAKDGQSFRLAFSVNNLFDRDPPYAQFRSTGVTIGYDPEQASAVGRSFALQAIVGW